MSIKRVFGKQSVKVLMDDKTRSWQDGDWSFCQNGYHSTVVNISLEQFEMLRELVVDPEVLNYYNSLKDKRGQTIRDLHKYFDI